MMLAAPSFCRDIYHNAVVVHEQAGGAVGVPILKRGSAPLSRVSVLAAEVTPLLLSGV